MMASLCEAFNGASWTRLALHHISFPLHVDNWSSPARAEPSPFTSHTMMGWSYRYAIDKRVSASM